MSRQINTIVVYTMKEALNYAASFIVMVKLVLIKVT